MFRPVCLALVCLFLLGAFLAVRTTIAVRAVPEAMASDPAALATHDIDDAPPLAKADKLPSADLDTMQTRVSAVPIEVAPVEKKTREPSKTEETVSWHWHAGSKISRRTGRPVQ